MWPRIEARWPGAQLYVAYDANTWAEKLKWSHGRVGEMALQVQQGLKQKGVVDMGRINGRSLARLQLQATAWLYPCDPIMPTETGCITAVEAGAAGTPMVITDADCLESEFGDVAQMVRLPILDDAYLVGVHDVIEDEDHYSALAHAGRAMAETRDWKDIAPRWTALMSG